MTDKRGRSTHANHRKRQPLCSVRTRSNSLECYEQLKLGGAKNGQPRPIVTATMRAILFDWLFQVSEQFRFGRLTTYGAFYICDKYLTKEIVQKERLQLLGVTALYVSHKLEESTRVGLQSFVDVADRCFPQDEIVEMERRILTSLKWNLTSKTLPYFINEITWTWDQFTRDTSIDGVRFREVSDCSSMENLSKLQQQCDYIILFPEVNEMQKIKVALALLYTFLKLHPHFQQASAELFGLKSRSNKLLQEVFSLFLREHFDIKLSALKKQISFLKYRRCSTKASAKRSSHNNSSSTAPRLSQAHEPFQKLLSYQMYHPQNLESFKLLHNPDDE